MIFTSIFLALINTLDYVILQLPKVDTIPLGIDAALVTLFGYWHTFLLDFPPFATLWTYMQFYFSFLILFVVVRIILGSRSPA